MDAAEVSARRSPKEPTEAERKEDNEDGSLDKSSDAQGEGMTEPVEVETIKENSSSMEATVEAVDKHAQHAPEVRPSSSSPINHVC